MDKKILLICDTNIFIGLERNKDSFIQLSFLKFAIKNCIRPSMTDYSICEIIDGCNDINSFFKTKFLFDELGFFICGCSRKLFKFITSFNYENLKKENDFKIFKNNLLKIKFETLYPYFISLFTIYTFVSCLTLTICDKKHFSDSIGNYMGLFFSNDFQNILKNYYFDFNFDNGKILQDLFKIVTVSIFKNSFNEDEILHSVDKKLKPNNYSKIGEFLRIDKFTDKNVFILTMRKIFKIQENYIFLYDGLFLLAHKYIFSNSSFCFNDIVDLVNMNYLNCNDFEVHYFTNDQRKWCSFLKIEEKNIENKKIFFNK